MSLRILHVLDHSIPLHSGYTFRTLSILRQQHQRGWETVQLTTPKQGVSAEREHVVDGLTFYRTPSSEGTVVLAHMLLTVRRFSQFV